ncbi:MAG: glycosyltransferase [Patescibacteria group bacterium]
MNSLSIVIPAYNEAKRLPAAVRDILNYVVNQPYDTEIIVVDDGSKDNTGQLIQSLYPSVVVLLLGANMGKGEAMRRGFFAARGDYILFTDADGSTPMSEFEKMKPYIDQFSVIMGSRRIPGADIRVPQHFFKAMSGRLGNLFIRFVLDLPFKDTQCGFKAFSKACAPLFEHMEVRRFGVDFELLARAQKLHLAIQEIPVTWYNSNTSSVRLKDYFQTYLDVFKVRKEIRRYG